MSEMVSRDGWRWYGFGGHLVVSKRCAYHLATIVGGYLVSTIGAYYPKNSDQMETIGAGAEDFFETQVFPCRGVDANGDPDSDLNATESLRYKTSIEAERGHYAICEKWHQRQRRQRR